MQCSIGLRGKARRFLEKAPRNIADKIKERLNELAENPVCYGRLKGKLKELCKTRVDSYRVAYQLKPCSILVIDIGPRESFYDKLMHI